MRIGVLALQGAVAEHLSVLELCGVEAVPVKVKSELEEIEGLVIPGGESTTIGKLMVKYELVGKVRELASKDCPIFGTCAGLILLAKRLTEGDQSLLELMDIEVRRNAFGRQIDSFEADLEIPELGEKDFPGVFIRAPWIEEVGPTVKVMSRFSNKITMAREANLLVTAFHPELTGDLRIHKYFVGMVEQAKQTARAGKKE